MRGPIRQTCHVAYEVAIYLIAVPSRIWNATYFRGSIHQSTSSRAHMDARHDLRWQKIERRINRLFFWQADHCKRAWDGEVARARKTLQRNGELP